MWRWISIMRFYCDGDIKTIEPYGKVQIMDNNLDEEIVIMAIYETGEIITLHKEDEGYWQAVGSIPSFEICEIPDDL